MYKTGRRPARHYKPIIATRVGVEWVINEDADAAIRGKKLTEIIEALIVHFPPERREFWRKSFQHIADGGSGAAPQLHAGKTLTQAQWNETAEAIKGRSQAGAAIKTDMSERGFKKRLAKRKGGRIVQKKG